MGRGGGVPFETAGLLCIYDGFLTWVDQSYNAMLVGARCSISLVLLVDFSTLFEPSFAPDLTSVYVVGVFLFRVGPSPEDALAVHPAVK
jgi:hypothetical protein